MLNLGSGFAQHQMVSTEEVLGLDGVDGEGQKETECLSLLGINLSVEIYYQFLSY